MQLTLGTAIATVFATYLAFAGHGSAVNSAWESYLAAHPIPSSTLASNRPVQTPTIEAVQAEAKKLSATSKIARVRCPANCNGSKPSNWTVYHDVDRLALCNRTMLLEFALYNPLDDLSTHASIRSCTADFDSSLGAPDRLTNGSCRPRKNLMQAEATLQMAWLGYSNATATGDVAAAAQQMERYIRQSEVGCNDTIAFAYSGQAALGLYAGSGIQSQGIATTVLQQFGAHVEANGVSESLLVQLCATKGRSSRFAFGIIANTNANLSFVQHTIKTWREGKCITEYDGAAAWQNVTFMAPKPPTWTNSTSVTVQVTDGLNQRATCTTIVAHSGESCGELAVECGITPAQFTVYNPSTALCSTQGQHFCCSSGTLPDFTPKPNSDGTCHSYPVQKGDTCSQLAAQYRLTVAQLESFNLKSWGWMGCSDLQAYSNICLSTGSPPMPATLVNAVCGPQVPGTPIPPAGTDLSTLNGCALNACCDMWGQCGTTDEFCIASTGPAGAPGTAAAGTNGCISNCGTQIVMGPPPASFRKIGYFEAFDSSRPCLNMPITNFDTTGYTHIHLAFATITLGWDVDVLAIEEQFLYFVQMTGFKKILSFGGWTFSTDPSTYFIFREAVQEPNRDTFVANVVAFVKKYNLDGVDFDWEYPAEPDMEGIPHGTAEESLNYFLFLNDLRNSLPTGTSLSIAAPAGFWYLRGFPIAAISLVVDYIIFMTYDLHGQWDYGHPYSDAGCPGGNCLQSHVNLTETLSALSMVTKAGVPSNKVVVGVTSYGRSFQMTTPGCASPECTYTGPLSGAYAGPCSQTPGYIGNAEIAAIIAGAGAIIAADGTTLEVTGSVQSYRDDSFSDIVVYDDTQWIAYMADDNKAIRTEVYAAYSLGGTTDWAVDLQSFAGGSGIAGGNNGVSVVYIDPVIFVEPNPEVAGTPPCVLVIPPSPLPTPSTISFAPIGTWIVVGQTIITVVTPLPITASVISFYNVPIEAGVTSKNFAVVSSLKPEPLVVSAGGTAKTITFSAGPTALPGSEVVIVNGITYPVIGGSVVINPGGPGVGALSVGVPPAKSTPQTLALPNGVVVTIPAITTSSFYSLPTTVYTSNGVTQTFSQAQFTDLATITTQTTVTTTLTEVEYGSSSTTTSTTPVAFWVGVGGFYWSPVPLPTPPPIGIPPIRIPSLPSFPKIPSFPCFKLFDIFSIDCPPDKSQPKTKFKSGHPSPTCKSGCGTLCTTDCNPQDDSTSSESSSSTSSSSSSSSTSFELCSQGCSACDALAARATMAPIKRELEGRTLLAPIDYGGVDKFMSTECKLASYPVPHGASPDLSTGISAPFLDKEFSMSVVDLYGCTSLIAVSDRGVYMSHFWEGPSFDDSTNFKEQVLDVLEDGYFSSHYKVSYALVPLRPLIAPGGILNSAASPHFFIFAPKNRAEMLNNAINNPSTDPTTTHNDPSLVPLMYESMVSDLQSFVRDLTGVTARVVEYDPNSFTKGQDTKYGKVLLQYDPANIYTKVNGCYQQEAIARLWIEGEDGEFTWPADANQKISEPEASAALKKRQGESCLLTSPTATASSLQITSTQPLPVQTTTCLTSSLTGCSYAYQYVEATLCTTTAPYLPARCTAAPTTTAPQTSSSLPTLPAQCVISSAVDCEWKYQTVDAADCPTTTTVLPVTCTNAQVIPTDPSNALGPHANTIVFCFSEYFDCKIGTKDDCTDYVSSGYFWFLFDGTTTCTSVYNSGKYIGQNNDFGRHDMPDEEDTTYHFITEALSVYSFWNGKNCIVQSDNPGNTASEADSFYKSLSPGDSLGTLSCIVGSNPNYLLVGQCYKGYEYNSAMEMIDEDDANAPDYGVVNISQLFGCDI